MTEQEYQRYKVDLSRYEALKRSKEAVGEIYDKLERGYFDRVSFDDSDHGDLGVICITKELREELLDFFKKDYYRLTTEMEKL